MEDALTTKFLYAALLGQADTLITLIDNGANINMKNDSESIMAGEGGFEPPLYGPEPHVLPLDDSPLKNKI